MTIDYTPDISWENLKRKEVAFCHKFTSQFI